MSFAPMPRSKSRFAKTNSLLSSVATSLVAIQAPSLWHHPHQGAENQTKTVLSAFFACFTAASNLALSSGGGAWCDFRNDANAAGSIAEASVLDLNDATLVFARTLP